MILPIYAYGQSVLRKKALPIPQDYPGLTQLIADMFETMYGAKGVGLAAPQIGKDIRLFVIDTIQLDKKNETSIGIKEVFINAELTDEILADTNLFIKYINAKLSDAAAKYGIGGYGENRTLYRRSKVFDVPDGAAPRSLHLGIDIWGKPHTKVIAPLNGILHSFAFNNAFGDYGATIILTHNLDGEIFHTLCGH